MKLNIQILRNDIMQRENYHPRKEPKTCNQYLQHFFGCHEDMHVLIFIRILSSFHFVTYHTVTFIKYLAIIRRHLLATAFKETDISHTFEKMQIKMN